MPRAIERARRSYLELLTLLEREGLEFHPVGDTRSSYFPTQPVGENPFQLVMAYPGRAMPGVALLEAYRRSQKLAGEARAGDPFRRIPLAALILSPRTRGVREVVVALPLPEFVFLLRDAGLVK